MGVENVSMATDHNLPFPFSCAVLWRFGRVSVGTGKTGIARKKDSETRTLFATFPLEEGPTHCGTVEKADSTHINDQYYILMVIKILEVTIVFNLSVWQ